MVQGRGKSDIFGKPQIPLPRLVRLRPTPKPNRHHSALRFSLGSLGGMLAGMWLCFECRLSSGGVTWHARPVCANFGLSGLKSFSLLGSLKTKLSGSPRQGLRELCGG